MDDLSDSELRDRVLTLFGEQSTMALATTDGTRTWAAPVYFVNKAFTLYFFSDPFSRHILESLSLRHASAAVFAPASVWQDIRGVQMSGTVHPLSVGTEAASCIAAYIKKFRFVKVFFKTHQAVTLDAFSKRFKVRFYSFIPDILYYSDNRVAFGFRAEVPVSQPFSRD